MTRIVLDVPVFGQREAECGNTSLKAVTWFLGHRYSATYLGRLARLTADGINHKDLVVAARRTGAVAIARDHGTLAQLRTALRAGLPAIVGWWSRDEGDLEFDPAWSLPERRKNDCGHYSVVCGMSDRSVQLMDPQWEERNGRYHVVGHRWMRKDDFLRAWYDTDTGQYVRVRRWFMVLRY